jgi:hypothetical protein
LYVYLSTFVLNLALNNVNLQGYAGRRCTYWVDEIGGGPRFEYVEDGIIFH